MKAIMPITPVESDLKTALVELKSEHPALGITKIHALLLSTHPEWAVSEKRTRKILQNEGLIVVSPTSTGQDQVAVYPSSRLIPHLEVSSWTPRVMVKYFNKKKGKGLIATEDILEGETVWKEDPFIIAPEWEIYNMQIASAACSYCTTPLYDSPLITTCPASSSSSFCHARFCNRLCLARSGKTHPLLCPAQNPASVPLLTFARDSRWMALHALAQCTSRILLATQLGEETLAADWEIIRGLAELGMEERHKYSFNSPGNVEPDRESWKKAYELFVAAFSDPKQPQEKKKLSRIMKKPPSADVARELFDYDKGFLKGLGRMSLNLEAHGGLYTLHSHLNHSCQPNVSVRHFDRRTALSRITLVAKRDIKAGEELLVTYVNPEANYKTRQTELRAWGFGMCSCERCVAEAKHVQKPNPAEVEMDDLADELKAGLGVV